MLQMTAIGIYAIFAGVTGTPVEAPIEATIPAPAPQVIVEKSKEEISATVDTEAFVRNYFKDTPILAEVARCESGFRQFDKQGNVLRGIKNNKDVGVMQVNEYYHLQTAIKMGYDLHKLEDNLAFAKNYLYAREGARPWLASSPCWSKAQGLASAVNAKYE